MMYIIKQGKKKLTKCSPVKFSYTGKPMLFSSKAQAEGFITQITKGKWSGLYRRCFIACPVSDK